MIYSVTQQSNQGGRAYNEDRTAVLERAGAVLLVVADGLGGHEGGDIASQAFVDALSDSFSKATDEQLQQGDTFLKLSINYAHHLIHRRAVDNGFDAYSPKTTCVVCLVMDGVATWAHSGDSRLYWIRRREIVLHTADHVSVANEKGNVPISRCVGGGDPPNPEISSPLKLLSGDTLILASDGAWHCFRAEDLNEYVDPSHPSLGIGSLLQQLENRNKVPSDNLSMVIFYWDVEQLDIDRKASALQEQGTIQLLNESIDKLNAPLESTETPTTDDCNKLAPQEIDSAIDDLEAFISDIDGQL